MGGVGGAYTSSTSAYTGVEFMKDNIATTFIIHNLH